MPKHAGGRPTDYGPHILRKTRAYLEACFDTFHEHLEDIEEEQEPQAHGGSLTRRYKVQPKVKLPTVGGLGRHLGIARSTIYKWAEEKPEFSDMLETLLSEQEDRLINNGLAGTYSSMITKLLLSKHGYVERKALEGADGGPIQIQNVEVNFKDA